MFLKIRIFVLGALIKPFFLVFLIFYLKITLSLYLRWGIRGGADISWISLSLRRDFDGELLLSLVHYLHHHYFIWNTSSKKMPPGHFIRQKYFLNFAGTNSRCQEDLEEILSCFHADFYNFFLIIMNF
jgi:hypothetical protein